MKPLFTPVSLGVILTVTLMVMLSPLKSLAVLEHTELRRPMHDEPLPSHMEIADRLLKRVLDITYETLEDLGASRQDLERVQQKRNYIQTCYFQAISCY
ncbi:hypothetical protein BsWGS_26682 [Bradybaena similaris]